jgi:hypothetical protein
VTLDGEPESPVTFAGAYRHLFSGLLVEHQGRQASNLHLAVCFDSTRTSCVPPYSAPSGGVSYTYLLRAR